MPTFILVVNKPDVYASLQVCVDADTLQDARERVEADTAELNKHPGLPLRVTDIYQKENT